MRLERLVGDVLDLAKLDARRFALLREEVDMRALCERAYATFAEEAKARGIDYELELDAGAVLITDGDRVLQIVTNLLSNALRWTPEGGRVDLGLSAAERRGDGGGRRHRAGDRAEERGADLPAVLVRRRRRHGPRPRDRARARAGARRPARAAQRARPRQPLRARATGAGWLSRLLDARRGGRRRRRRASARSSSSPSRSSTLRQPEAMRSTSSARSSTRACRSARMSPSMRSSRRITWFVRPRTSAR